MAPQVTGEATVMSPAWLPGEPLPPVNTVTLAAPRAFCSVVVLITESSPVGVMVVLVSEASVLVFVPVEMVTFSGSRSSVPVGPDGAVRLVKPV